MLTMTPSSSVCEPAPAKYDIIVSGCARARQALSVKQEELLVKEGAKEQYVTLCE